MNSEKMKKAGGVFLVAASVGLGFWIFLALADVITFVWAFCHFNNVIEVYGTTNEFVNKGLAALLAGLIVWFIDKVAISVVKRNKKWIPIVVGIIIAISAVMYFVSWPFHGALTDVTTGEPAKQCYRDQDGRIQTIGLGAKAGPSGEAVRPCTKEDQQEYQRQTGGQGTSFLGRLFGEKPEVMSLHADVEQVEVFPDKTVLHFAVRRINNFRLGRFYQPHGWNYLSDENGQTYNLTSDNAAYPDWVDAESHEDFDYSGKQHAETRILRPDEVYRFTALYAPVPNINHLRLHDSRFGPVDLDYLLAQGEAAAQVRAQAEAQSRAQAEADAKAQAQAQTEAQAQAEADARVQAQQEAEAQARAAEEAQAQAQAQAEADARAQAQQEAEAQARAAEEAQAQAQVYVYPPTQRAQTFAFGRIQPAQAQAQGQDQDQIRARAYAQRQAYAQAHAAPGGRSYVRVYPYPTGRVYRAYRR